MAAGRAAGRLAARRLAAGRGAAALRAAGVFAARSFAGLLAGNHPAQRHRLLVGDAHGHGAGRLARDLASAPHRVRFGPLLRDALAARHLALLLAHLSVVARHFASDRMALTDALAAGNRIFLPRGAGHPAADRLHGRAAARLAAGIAAAIAARIAAVIAATVPAMEAALEPAGEAVAALTAARDLPAFPVAAIDAATASGRDRLVGDARLHDGALFDGRHAHADAAGHGPRLGDSLPHRASARPGFRIALALVSGVGLLPALGAIARAGAGVGLGDPSATR